MRLLRRLKVTKSLPIFATTLVGGGRASYWLFRAIGKNLNSTTVNGTASVRTTTSDSAPCDLSKLNRIYGSQI